MGNIARTIHSYALRRYQCNLEAVWSNLQRVVQKDHKANAALLESKTQLDFLVSCCWLTLLWSLVWAIVFAFVVKSRIGFLSAALGGPLVAYMWYRIAAEQYCSFADVAMTTLDVFRFALLEQMRLGIAFKMIRERDPNKHFKALRYLGANTRLAEKLLVKPENVSLEESYLLDQELKKFDGKYLNEDVATKMAVEVDNVSDWPDIEPTESFPVETQTEPDCLLLNQGSLVQVWVNNKPSLHRARVLRTVP